MFHHSSSRLGKDDKGKKAGDKKGYYYRAKSPVEAKKEKEKKDLPTVIK